jgi:23S rRNA pseudouridine2605 synthase
MLERLNKLIANAGIASRRQAEELILGGMVSVNGTIVRELGTKADPETDSIKVNGKLINKKLEKRENVYILLNKPKGYLSSVHDPEGRKLVTDLVRGFGKLHPVGRLDYQTEGLLILTNDGEFTNKVAASKTVPKIYEVKTKGIPNPNALNKLRRGIKLEDGFKTAPTEIKELKPTENNGWYEVTLFEGHNQQIRKMFDAVGHSVVKLRRMAIGNVKDERIPVGAYRELDAKEVRDLMNPTVKSPKKIETKPTEKKSDGDKPKLRPNSRYVEPKKPKFAKKTKADDKNKPKRSLKDAYRKAVAETKDKAEPTFTETTPTRFKKPAGYDSAFGKFKSKMTRKPKRQS